MIKLKLQVIHDYNHNILNYFLMIQWLLTQLHSHTKNMQVSSLKRWSFCSIMVELFSRTFYIKTIMLLFVNNETILITIIAMITIFITIVIIIQQFLIYSNKCSWPSGWNTVKISVYQLNIEKERGTKLWGKLISTLSREMEDISGMFKDIIGQY